MYKTAVVAVKDFMNATGKNQAQAAIVIDVSRVSLNKWLKHPNIYPDKASQDKLIKAFPKLTRDDILGPVV